jgi:dTDP-4-dehydrorhamnose 3,5-epimerase
MIGGGALSCKKTMFVEGSHAPRMGIGMNFRPTAVAGAFIVELEPRADERGFFARMFCTDQFAAAGLERRIAQVSTSFTRRRGTLRGLHYQLPPTAEVKLVRCLRGAVFDVVADLRPDSPSFGQWAGAELSAENRAMMYVPRGCAHGFLTLTDEAEMLYFASDPYAPACERGVRFDDPWLGIAWPALPKEMSAKDRGWPPFDTAGPDAARLTGLCV